MVLMLNLFSLLALYYSNHSLHVKCRSGCSIDTKTPVVQCTSTNNIYQSIGVYCLNNHPLSTDSVCHYFKYSNMCLLNKNVKKN